MLNYNNSKDCWLLNLKKFNVGVKIIYVILIYFILFIQIHSFIYIKFYIILNLAIYIIKLKFINLSLNILIINSSFCLYIKLFKNVFNCII